jgi:hypothetical protein
MSSGYTIPISQVLLGKRPAKLTADERSITLTFPMHLYSPGTEAIKKINA